MACFSVKYTVEGKGHFPTDMLRYDHSVYETDADLRAANPGEYVSERRVVHLEARWWGDSKISDVRRSIASEYGRPCGARWASFNWTLTEVGEPEQIRFASKVEADAAATRFWERVKEESQR